MYAILIRLYAKDYQRISGATKIQRQWRRRQDQQTYLSLKTAIRFAQQRWRIIYDTIYYTITEYNALQYNMI